MVDIVANEPTEVAFLTDPGYPKSLSEVLLQPPRSLRQSACHFLTKEPAYVPPHPHTSPKTIRGRLLSYLSFLHKKRATTSSTSPLTANNWQIIWGSTARLSNELSKMQREGHPEFQKNHFKLTPDCL